MAVLLREGLGSFQRAQKAKIAARRAASRSPKKIVISSSTSPAASDIREQGEAIKRLLSQGMTKITKQDVITEVSRGVKRKVIADTVRKIEADKARSVDDARAKLSSKMVTESQILKNITRIPERKISTEDVQRAISESTKTPSRIEIGGRVSGTTYRAGIGGRPVSSLDDGVSVKRLYESKDLQDAKRMIDKGFISEKETIEGVAAKLYKARKIKRAKRAVGIGRAVDKFSKIDSFNKKVDSYIDKAFKINRDMTIKISDSNIVNDRAKITRLLEKKQTPNVKNQIRLLEDNIQRNLANIRKAKTPGFGEQVLNLSIKKLNSTLNPFVVGVNVGGVLSAVRDLSSAGITKDVIRKGVDIGVKGVSKKNIVKAYDSLRNIKKEDVNKVSSAVSKQVVKLSKNLNPKTAEGLSNIIVLGAIFRADKLGAKAVKSVIRGIKNPSVKRVLRAAALSPLSIATGAVSTVGKGVKVSGKPLSKAAKKSISAGVFKKAPTKLSKQAVKRERVVLRKEQKKAFDLIPVVKQKDVSPTAKFKYFEVSKGKVVFKRGKKVIGVAKGKLLPRSTGGVVSSTNINKSVGRAVDRSIKEVGSGKGFLLTKKESVSVSKGVANKVPVLRKKIGKVLNNKQEMYSSSSKFVKDMRPEKLFPELIEQETQIIRGGFRPGVKEKLFKSLNSQKEKLLRERKDKFKNYIKLINDKVLSKAKTNIEKTKLFNDFLRSSRNPAVFNKFKISKSTINKIDNSFRAISKVNFKIGSVEKISIDIKKIPVSGVKRKSITAQASKPTITPISKIVSSSVIKKLKKVSVKSKKIKKIVRPVKILKKEKKIVQKVQPFKFKPAVKKVRIVKETFKPKKFKVKIKKSKVKKGVKPKVISVGKVKYAFTPTITSTGKRKKLLVKGEEYKFYTGLEYRG